MISALMNISALAGVASLPPLSVPDFWVCDHWYAAANELMTEDCVMAVRSMPSGFDRVRWHNGAGGSEEYRFPLTRTYGENYPLYIFTELQYEPYQVFTVVVATNNRPTQAHAK